MKPNKFVLIHSLVNVTLILTYDDTQYTVADILCPGDYVVMQSNIIKNTITLKNCKFRKDYKLSMFEYGIEHLSRYKKVTTYKIIEKDCVR